MKLLKFNGKGGKPIWINPEQVTVVYWDDSTNYTVIWTHQTSFQVNHTLNKVVMDLVNGYTGLDT